MFTQEEISAAKATRDAIINGEMPKELKAVYMAGEICTWDELSNPKEPGAVSSHEAKKGIIEGFIKFYNDHLVDKTNEIEQLDIDMYLANLKP